MADVYEITAVVGGAGGTFTVAGNQTARFPVATEILVTGSVANDGTYTVGTVTFVIDHTDIVVDEVVPDATVAGVISAALIAQANALISVEDAAAYLGVVVSDDVQTLINRASDYAEWWCNRPLKERAYTNVRLEALRSCHLRPVATPINAGATIGLAYSGTALTVWRAEADGDPADFDVILASDVNDPRWRPNHFYRARGWDCSGWRNPYPILLSYTGGLATIPGDLIEAILLTIRSMSQAQSGLGAGGDIQSFNGPVVGQTVFRGDGSLIPLRAKYLLDSYRVIFV